MGNLKSSILYTIAIVSFVSGAWAHGGNVEYDGEDTIHPDHKLHDGQHHEGALAINREEFLKNLPSEPQEVLKYVIDKLNQAEAMGAGKNSVYRLQYVDKVSSPNMIDIKPRFTEDNRIFFDFNLNKTLANNPLYVLEVMKVLMTFYTNPAEVQWHQKASYIQYHTYVDQHGNYLTDYKKHHHVHYMEQVSHSILTMLGVQRSEHDKSMDRPLAWAEREVNAKSGSAYAAREIRERELGAIKSSMQDFPKFLLIKNMNDADLRQAVQEIAKAWNIQLNPSQSTYDMALEYFTQRGGKAAKALQAQEKLAKDQYRQENQYFDNPTLKAEKDKLENLPQKLDDFVKSNNREGVAKLFETFLPLDIMEPVEKGLWLDWIEAIRHPDTKNAKLVFRGLDKDNDKLQMSKDGKSFGLFSTLLIRNQGNYTRRLRSYATMRYRFQNYDTATKSPVEVTPSVAVMMNNHAGNPTGSPMLSFSTEMKVANNFATSGIIAAKIDPRRMMPNAMSVFDRELEMLVPLVVFPDEIIAAEMADKNVPIDLQNFTDNLNKALGHDYKLDEIKGTKSVYMGAYKVFADAQEDGLVMQCRGIFK